MRPNPLPPHHYWIMKLRSNYTQSPTSSLFGYHFSYPRERRHGLPLTTHHLPCSVWAPWQSQDSRGIYCKAINIMVFIVDLQLLRRVVVVAPAAALLSPLMLFAYTCARVRQTQNQQTMRFVIIHTTSQPPPPLNPTSFSHGGWKWCRPLQIHSNPPSRYSTFRPIPSRWQWDTCRDPSCTVLFENTNGIEKSSVVFQMMMIIQIPPPPFIQSFGIQFVQPLVCRFLFSRRRRECDCRSVEEDPQPRLHS